MTTSKKTAAKRVASQPQDRRAPAPDLEAIRSAVREVLNDLDPTRGVDLKLTMAHGGYFDEPSNLAPITPVEMALDENAKALGQLHDALSVLGDRLERTVMPPAPAADNAATASPAFGASPVLHRLTSLHSGIESAAARVHNILARLEA